MLAKGHDFARLNLVIVLNADGSLYSADFRAPERLFAELMQVSGRAGRADKPGKVLIQTQPPEHPVFAAVKAQDYAVFAENELNERQMFAMPPFGFQAASVPMRRVLPMRWNSQRRQRNPHPAVA